MVIKIEDLKTRIIMRKIESRYKNSVKYPVSWYIQKVELSHYEVLGVPQSERPTGVKRWWVKPV